MIILLPKKLIITINDNCPKDRLQWITQALTTTIKWNAFLKSKGIDDPTHQVVIAELLLELSNSKKVGNPRYLDKIL